MVTTMRFADSRLGAAILAPLLGAAVAAGTLWLSRGDSLAHVVILAVGILAVVAALRWRYGVYLLLVYVTIEGVVTSLLYPAPYPVLFKDGLVLCIYLGFLHTVLVSGDKCVFPRTVARPLTALIAVCAVESFNPAGGGPAVALVGIRTLLLYIPLFFVGAYLGRDQGALDRIVHRVLFLSVPVTAFGIWEHFAGPDAVVALGSGFAQSVWIVGPEATHDAIFRPASTFAFVGHFGDFLFFIALLCLGAISAPLTLRRRAALAVVLCLTMVAMVLNAQRATWTLLPVGAVALFAINRPSAGVVRTLPALAAAVLLATSVGGAILADRLPLLTDSGALYTARFQTAQQPFTDTLLSPAALTGHGTGTALGAERYVNGGSVPVTFESGWAIPLSMLGIWGVGALAWLYAAVFRLMWRGRRLLGRDQRWVPGAILVFCVLSAVVNGSINYPPKNVYFWLFAGMVSAPALVQRGRQESEAELPTASRGRQRVQLHGGPA